MDGIALMASAMHAAQKRLDVSADNLANLSSDGFQRHIAHAKLGASGIAAWRELDGAPGALRHTGRNFDLATTGGALLVADGKRAMAVRSGSFVLDAAGHLVDSRGRLLLGEHVLLKVPPDAAIDARGVARAGERPIGRLRLAPGTTVESGFLEASNVDAVKEMVDILSAQRAFETAQKALSAIDDSRAKAVNDVVRVRS